MSAQTAPSLPSRELPNGSAELPSRPGSEQHQADVAATTEATAPRTRADRIRVATAQGGLTELPARFDDSHGDWESVLAPSLFERLYLDASQHAAITPAMVLGNYAILRSFWDEKIAAMQTGAAKTQILIKFGGEHRSEELVLSYPRELKKAAEQLSAPNGIVAYHQQLDRDRIESAHRILASIIEFILVDDSLEPVESEGYFTHAVAAALTLDEAATLLQAAIEERHFKPVATPGGRTLHEKLRSVQWVSEARFQTIQAAKTSMASNPEATKPPAPRAPLIIPPPEVLVAANPASSSASPGHGPPLGIIVFVVAIGVPLIIVVIISVLAMLFGSSTDAERSASTPAQTRPASPVSSVVTTPPFPIPALETTGDQPATDTALAELERMKRQAIEAARARRAVAEDEERERREAEEHRVATLREEMANAIGRATERIAARDFTAAHELLAEVRPKTVSDPTTYMSEQIEIDRLLMEADRGATQMAAFKVRLSEAQTMNANGQFAEAITIANRLLGEPDLPADLNDGAKAVLAFAQEKKKAAETKGKHRLWHRSKSD